MRANGLQSGLTATVPSPGQQQLVAGGGSLGNLRATAHQDPKAAIKEVAKQFETLFMQELMKSMRATTMAEDASENNAGNMATGMLDQQYSTQLTGRPGGLADAIARQLERQMGGSAAAVPPAGTQGMPLPGRSLSSSPSVGSPVAAQVAAAYGSNAAAGDDVTPASTGTAAAQSFLQRNGAAAQTVAAESGIPAHFMLAQAAHETGWGRKEIRGADGATSNNFFGIKAGSSWTGPTVTATTTEVINGQPQKVQARFRAYATPEDSFRDYARLIGNSPRYAGVMRAGHDAQAFAQGLQRAGYATDPQYAAKLGRVIQTTERLQRNNPTA